MAELLFSLSIWLMVGLVLLPMTLKLLQEAEINRQTNEAIHLLYEELQAFKLEGKPIEDQSIIRNKQSFQIVSMEIEKTSKKKVCVQFESMFKKKVQKCETIE